jgi:hypothetical protein
LGFRDYQQTDVVIGHRAHMRQVDGVMKEFMRFLDQYLFHTSKQAHRGWILAGLCTWLVVVASGMGLLASYANQAGASASTVPQQIASSSLADGRTHRLVMFVHPYCPCSNASMAELARLMSRCTEKIETTVYFYRPENQPDRWVEGALWSAAKRIPGVSVQTDSQGRIAAQFGATTSGHVILYGPLGDLRFHGGITARRGHEGDSTGKATVMSIVQGDNVNVGECPVFGCALRPTAARNSESR